MSDVYVCPECEHEFNEIDGDTVIQNIDFNPYDDAIQAVSLIYCPSCKSVVMAMFDSLECTEQPEH